MGQTEQLDVVAMVLAGGRGKRMDILCYLRPKPSLPFAGKFRVVDFVLSNCLHSGISQVAALVDYQRLAMERYFNAWHASNQGLKGLDVLVPRYSSYCGTADAVFQNLGYLHKLGTNTVLVLAGDHIYKMDYRPMLDFHKRVKADVTIGVIPALIEQAHRFGIVTTDNSGRIVDFVEKPSMPHSNLVSMGIYIFNKDVLCQRLAEDARRSESSHDFGYVIIPDMVKRDRAYAYKFNDYWQDIGTVESYYQANIELTQQTPMYSLDSNWHILTKEVDSLTPDISGQGSVKNSIVSSGCVIRGEVENSVLSPGVVIEERAVVRNSVLMADTRIGYHTVVDRCILDEGVDVGKCCYIGLGQSLIQGDWDITVLGMKVTIPSFTAIGRRCNILPRVRPEDLPSGAIPGGSTISKRLRQYSEQIEKGEQKSVNARVYLLLNIVPGKSRQAARLLRSEPGVTVVDLIEGSPDVIVMIEALERQSLAQFTVRAIASVESLTTDLQLLPAKGSTERECPKSCNSAETAGQKVTREVAVIKRTLYSPHKT